MKKYHTIVRKVRPAGPKKWFWGVADYHTPGDFFVQGHASTQDRAEARSQRATENYEKLNIPQTNLDLC